MVPFQDRRDAGRRLAEVVKEGLGGEGNPLTGRTVVLGLPRGGVVVAAEVATALGLPLDVILARKLGVPAQPELAMGALGEDGILVLDERLVRRAGVTDEQLEAVEERASDEMQRQLARFRSGRPRVDLRDRIAVIVDDGIATGATAAVACRVARAAGASEVVMAVPVAPPRSVRDLLRSGLADRVLYVASPPDLMAVGEAYLDFSQTTDDEVVELLRSSGGAS